MESNERYRVYEYAEGVPVFVTGPLTWRQAVNWRILAHANGKGAVIRRVPNINGDSHRTGSIALNGQPVQVPGGLCR